jgi:hypothetical protein
MAIYKENIDRGYRVGREGPKVIEGYTQGNYSRGRRREGSKIRVRVKGI